MSDTPSKPAERSIERHSKRKLPQKFLLYVIATGIVLLVLGIAIGVFIAPRDSGPSNVAATVDAIPTLWTCSMHPQIKLPKPGKCPICFMDLIPLEDDGGEELGPRQLRLSATAARLAEIQTTPVVREYATNVVRMAGKVEYDETKVVDITAWVPGRLDRLYVDYTGIRVRKGDHLVLMYSPELIVAQRELIQTMKSAERLGKLDRELSLSTLKSVEEKLRLLGLLPAQIEEIKQRGKPTDQLTIYAPSGGIVIEKLANEGMYVKTGTKIYTIADLSVVWVYLEAYESDLPWLRYGQDVEFTTEAYPGTIFHGRVAFIDPVLNEKTRSVRVRVTVPNPDGKLKPGMFVRATVHSKLAADGRVFDTSLAGKWISPMHPEVIKDGPGKCDVCGMDLVPAEELGYAIATKAPEVPLLIPATAPLITGKRAVVYVQLSDREQPTFEGREVLLGPRAGDSYIVRHGLREGEQVVTQGNFKIDSALQIRAKPSMMSPEGGASATGHQHGSMAASDRHTANNMHDATTPAAFRKQLAHVYDAYLDLQTALADDRLEDARRGFAALQRAIAASDATLLSGRILTAWQAALAQMKQALEGNAQTIDLENLRKQFEPISNTLLGVVDSFGHTRSETLHKAFCPMAFGNKGAAWLQVGDVIANPYFGHQMHRCGEIQRDFPPVGDTDGQKRGKEVKHEH